MAGFHMKGQRGEERKKDMGLESLVEMIRSENKCTAQLVSRSRNLASWCEGQTNHIKKEVSD